VIHEAFVGDRGVLLDEMVDQAWKIEEHGSLEFGFERGDEATRVAGRIHEAGSAEPSRGRRAWFIAGMVLELLADPSTDLLVGFRLVGKDEGDQRLERLQAALVKKVKEGTRCCLVPRVELGHAECDFHDYQSMARREFYIQKKKKKKKKNRY
jgi:hypothetical protein